ncbi:hypothetical protein C8R45DRAFT_1113819 [Mycena sanguinolenta]|nr:hypothetical protein C8R45DRAFT_1113819 [Mycena sanguinolenta]
MAPNYAVDMYHGDDETWVVRHHLDASVSTIALSAIIIQCTNAWMALPTYAFVDPKKHAYSAVWNSNSGTDCVWL